MKSRKPLLALVAAGAMLAPLAAHASGYSIFEQGAAVLGMGGAGVASVQDPSAVFYNPAALTRLDGTHLYAGGTLLTPSTSFAGVAPYPGFGVTEEMEPQWFFPPTLYLTHRFEQGFAAALGLNTPFGLGVDWKDPSAFSGRYIVTQANLSGLDASLSGAYAFGPRWSIGAGLDMMFARVELERHEMIPAPGGGGGQVDVAKTNLTSNTTTGWGWNLGASYVPAPGWRASATYRGKVVVDAEGDADITQISTGNAALDSVVALGLPPDQAVSTVLRFPAIWSAGLAWQPAQEWTLEADVNFFEWSVFEDLPLRFHQTPSANQTVVEDYEDAFQFRFGAEHRLPKFTYRFGYYFDQAAAPDESVSPILPDADRHGLTLGTGFGIGADKRWTVDLYDLVVLVAKRSTSGVQRDGYNGQYQTFINAFGAAISHRW